MAKTVNLVQRKIFWIMIIILLAGIFLIYLSQQPAIGTIKVLTPSHITEPKNENESTREKERRQFAEKAEKIGEDEAGKAGFGNYNGKYFSFRYPNSYELKTTESSSSGILEKVIFLGSGISTSKLTVMVTEIINANSLAEVSAIQLRRLRPETYQEKSLDLLGKKGVLFEKKVSSFEKTAFFLEKPIIFSIALTSANINSDLDDDFDFILKEFIFL